jgi:hypothetical protein
VPSEGVKDSEEGNQEPERPGVEHAEAGIAISQLPCLACLTLHLRVFEGALSNRAPCR